MDNTIRVRVESFDGTAKAGSDYVQVNEQLVFGPYAKERELTVKIIDDNQWEPDEEFFLRLSIVDDGYDRKDVVLGRLPIMEIIILNDDGKKQYLVIFIVWILVLMLHNDLLFRRTWWTVI